MNALERLEDLLNEKDSELDTLRGKLEEVENRESIDRTAWTRHREYKVDPSPDLPVPRLELRWVEQERDRDGYEIACEYSLVYRHVLDKIVFVPLGMTRSTGSLASRDRDGRLETPFRDGAHFANEAAQLRLPAFVIVGDKVQQYIPCAKCGRLEDWHRNGVDCSRYVPMELQPAPTKKRDR